MSVRLHHIVSGPPGAPVLVFLHGFLGSAADWRQVVQSLDSHFRCITIDLPGHGASTNLPDEAYSWDGAVDGIAHTLDEMGVRRFRLIGYSMGGRLAMGLALRHRRRVARLVLIGASPGFRREADRIRRIELDRERAEALASDLPAFVRVWYRMPLFASLDERPDVREALIAPVSLNGIRTRLQNNGHELARALEGLSTGRMPDYWGRLDDLGAPTLALAGMDDPKFVDLAYRMAGSGLPIAPFIMPDVGHLIPIERPQALADVVRDFCRDAIVHGPAMRLVSQAA